MDWDSVLLWTSCVTLGKSLENLVLKNNRPIIAARMKHQSFWDHRCKPGPAYLSITEKILPGDPFWKVQIRMTRTSGILILSTWKFIWNCTLKIFMKAYIKPELFLFFKLVLCTCVKPIMSRIFIFSRDAVCTVKYWIYSWRSTPYSNQLTISIN